MNTPLSRRKFLGGLAAGATAPLWLRYGDGIAQAAGKVKGAAVSQKRLLVVFLRGGNDPLETVSPIGNAQLLKLRPNLALREGDVISLGSGYGINKALPTVASLWKSGKAAIIQGVGPSDANLSHGAAQQRWETASNDGRYSNGWLGRYLDLTPSTALVPAAGFADEMPLSLLGTNTDTLTLRTIEDFGFYDKKSADAAMRHAALGRFGASGGLTGPLASAVVSAQRELLQVADPLEKIATQKLDHPATAADNVAQMFASELGTWIGFMNVGGFDTHVGERAGVTRALTDVDAVVKNFFATATALGVADDSVVLIITEFGRRVRENQSGGTDHGHASTVLALGSGVNPGFHGSAPDFGALDHDNWPALVDFRSVYATVLSKWLTTNPEPILGGSFPTLPFIK